MSAFAYRAWRESLESPGSALQLAALRVVIGVHLLTVFSSPALPLLQAIGGHPHPMTGTAVPAWLEAQLSDAVVTVAASAGSVAALCMVAGLLTRVAVVVALLSFLITQHYWFRTTVFHDDWIYFVFPLLVLAFARTSDRLALDSWLKRRAPLRGAERQAYRWPVELIASWFAFLYVAAGIAKLFPLRKGIVWLSGRSVQQFAVEFLPDSPIFWLHGRSLFDYTLLWPFCLASWLTLLVELGAAAIWVLPRARPWIWCALFGMHLSIWCMGIPGFVQIALVFGVAMLPADLFRDATAEPSRRDAILDDVSDVRRHDPTS